MTILVFAGFWWNTNFEQLRFAILVPPPSWGRINCRPKLDFRPKVLSWNFGLFFRPKLLAWRFWDIFPGHFLFFKTFSETFFQDIFRDTFYQGTVGNFHRFSDIGDIVPQKWVKWTHRWIKCAENWFQIFLASGLYDHVAFGLENFVTLMKIGMLSRREKIFLHAKIQQIRSRNGWDTAQIKFLPWPFIYWLCKAVEANPRKSPKWAFHQ